MSFSSLQTAPNDVNGSPPIRIRSKVSDLSKVSTNENTSPTLQPATPSYARVRSPSTSSSVSQMRSNLTQSPPPTIPAPQFYPITAGSPAANPYRYGPKSPPSQHSYQGLAILSPDSQSPGVNRPRVNSIAKVKLQSIPLPPPPPHSPPGSTVSFSSKSSLSQSSQGEPSQNATPLEIRHENGSANPPSKGQEHPSPKTEDVVDDDSDRSDSDSDERKVKAEAKSNRKMADLEITNRSLLTINASLEATKNKQAKEIRELRRKLRESRLILPPRDFRAVKSSLGPEEEEEADDDDDSEVEDAAEGNGDEIYKRVKLMLEGLISSGKKALETKVEDFPEGAKVLTAEEVQSWQRSNAEDLDNYSDLDSASISQVDISAESSSVEGDPEDDSTPPIGQNVRFSKSSGPPIHISEVD